MDDTIFWIFSELFLQMLIFLEVKQLSPITAVNLLFSCISFSHFPVIPLPLSPSFSCLETLVCFSTVCFLKRIILLAWFNTRKYFYALKRRFCTPAWGTKDHLDSTCKSHFCPSLSLATWGSLVKERNVGQKITLSDVKAKEGSLWGKQFY